MKKIVNVYRAFELVLFLWIFTCIMFAILNIMNRTNVNWFFIVSPFIAAIGIPLIGWLIGFFYLIGKDIYGRYYHWKAKRLVKTISRDIDRIENELK